MSKDTIYREDAIKTVCEGCLSIWKTCQHRWDCPALTNLTKLPSADRPHGEWKHDGSVWTYRFNCTNCGYHLLGRQTNFCPNCGARMDGDRKENER